MGRVDYIDISPRVKLLDTGLSFDNKELISLEQIVKTAPKGRAHFTSNVMAIVGEGIREAEVNAFGNKIKTIIPRHIDKIVKTHNTISQEALNGALFAWVYSTFTLDNPPLYVQSGTNSIVFIEPSGQQFSLSPGVYILPNGQSSYTFLFIVNDTSTNSYSVTQEQLFPWVVHSYSSGDDLQLAIPLSTANLVVSKSSNQIFTFIWAIQLNLSSSVSGNLLIGLFYPGIKGYYNVFGFVPQVSAFSGSTTYFSGDASYYYININGVLYAMAIATDASSNSYTPSSVSAPYWGIGPSDASGVAQLYVTTPPNSPGSKPAYAAVSWYNALYLTA